MGMLSINMIKNKNKLKILQLKIGRTILSIWGGG